jgi:hypothetical protein
VVTALEEKIHTFFEDIKGDARAELAKVGPLLTQFETDAKALLAADAPTLKADLAALIDKLLADAGSVLGSTAAGM